ncbi:MAG TPA: cobalt-precorrin-5B (C(1))-methyltransferase CbiD [Candidatus Avanaerovorax faecigallinarum]|nr:cobalt-precorrin-5B (C(1))-methyltransferase CbiD [Candidatus Avanaerovorax faecigallinarum]
MGQRVEGVSEEKDDYVVKNGERLRCGFTTGSCAAAASSAAAEMALTGWAVPAVSIRLPKGEEAAFTVNNREISRGYAKCSVTKDGGDDPDVTTGLEIFSEVRLTSEENAEESGRVIVDGGPGVGRVTKPGLARKPGEAAINPVPLEMIEKNVRNVLDRHGFKGDAEVNISVPGGEETARKTFNPRLGIEGGISILGTTGIVEPMSEKALIDTVIAEINVHRARDSEKIMITPGNYGSDFIEGYLGLDIRKAVQCSNFIGETLDYLRYAGFKKILLAGHTGKLIKLASGIMNTHSSYADGRMEIIASHAAMSGASPETVKNIMDCITTDQALDLVKSEPFYEDIKKSVTEKVMEHLNFRLKDECEIEVVMFTSDRGHIMKSPGADSLIREFM